MRTQLIKRFELVYHIDSERRLWLALFSEETTPWGCKRVHQGRFRINDGEVRHYSNNSRKLCMGWLNRAARLFGVESFELDSAAELAKPQPRQRHKPSGPTEPLTDEQIAALTEGVDHG